MIFNDFISLVADFCLYSATLGFIISLCGETANPLILAGAYILSIAVSLLLRKVKGAWRFLPPLIFLAALFFTHAAAGVVWILPLFLLLELRAYTYSWNAVYERTKVIFIAAASFFIVLSLCMILSGKTEAYNQYSLPYFIAWLLLTVLDLRLLRAPDTNTLGVRYKVLNILLVLAVAVLAYLVSSDTCITAVKVALSFLYDHIIMPIFIGVVYVIIAIPAVIAYIIGLIASLFTGKEPAPLEFTNGQGEQILPDEFTYGNDPAAWIGKAAAALGLLILLFICFLVFKKIITKREDVTASFGNISRETIRTQNPTRVKKRFSFTDSPEDSVRNAYRKYLELCDKHDIPVDGSLASDKICRESIPFSGSKLPFSLRMIWLRARYSFEQITSDEAKEAKALLKEIRNYSTNQNKVS